LALIFNIIKALASRLIMLNTTLMALAKKSVIYLESCTQSLSQAFTASVDKTLKMRAPDDHYFALEKKSMPDKNLKILYINDHH
jgi:hypothetical protein